MTSLSNRVQGKLQQSFDENNMTLSFKSDHIIVNDSENYTMEKIQEIIKSVGFFPLISRTKDNNIVFTVCPFAAPDFFIPNELKRFGRIEFNAKILSKSLVSSQKSENLYFTKKDLTILFNSRAVINSKIEKIEDKWEAVNHFRSFVSSALSKGLCELISKNVKNDHPIIEIGSGIGYSLDKVPNIIRTQRTEDECKLLGQTTSEPIYKLDIEGIYNTLLESGKKIPLFFALDVFDTFSSQLRKTSLFQLSQLQNSGDRILIMLDTNPCLDVIIEQLETLYPDDVMLPYYPLSNDPSKMSLIVVPSKNMTKKPSHEDLINMINQEAVTIMTGKVSEFQKRLHQMQEQLDLQVIHLEDFFAKQVSQELLEAGYETEIYYHNSFTSGELPKGLSAVKQDLVYKPVTDTASVRQWSLKDEKLIDSLAKKNLKLPEHFNDEFLSSLKQNQHKIFGAEILVINAKKI